MRRALRAVGKVLSAAVPDRRDVLAFGGLGLVGYGLWQLWPPAAFIVVGAALFYLAVWR